MPTFGSLFAGIGGIDLGLERAGWECRWQVEWDPFCQRVLAKHWPDVPRHGDIHDVHGRDFCPVADPESGSGWSDSQAVSGGSSARRLGGGGCSACLPSVDLLAGGFPCQPFSVAGKQRRLDDDRWLWPEFARAIRELGPRYVLVENVPGLLVGGGMDAVLGDLAELGYDAEWESIPAAAVGAPHLRYRVWIIAYRQADAPRTDADGLGPHRAAVHVLGDAERRDEQDGDSGQMGGAVPDADGTELRNEPVSFRRRGGEAIVGHDGADGEMADAHGAGPAGPGGVGNPDGASTDPYAEGRGSRGTTSEPSWWSVEPDVGRVAHGVPARVDRLRSLGNAVVPQVVEWIGRRLMDVYKERAA